MHALVHAPILAVASLIERIILQGSESDLVLLPEVVLLPEATLPPTAVASSVKDSISIRILTTTRRKKAVLVHECSIAHHAPPLEAPYAATANARTKVRDHRDRGTILPAAIRLIMAPKMAPTMRSVAW